MESSFSRISLIAMFLFCFLSIFDNRHVANDHRLLRSVYVYVCSIIVSHSFAWSTFDFRLVFISVALSSQLGPQGPLILRVAWLCHIFILFIGVLEAVHCHICEIQRNTNHLLVNLLILASVASDVVKQISQTRSGQRALKLA